MFAWKKSLLFSFSSQHTIPAHILLYHFYTLHVRQHNVTHCVHVHVCVCARVYVMQCEKIDTSAHQISVRCTCMYECFYLCESLYNREWTDTILTKRKTKLSKKQQHKIVFNTYGIDWMKCFVQGGFNKNQFSILHSVGHLIGAFLFRFATK